MARNISFSWALILAVTLSACAANGGNGGGSTGANGGDNDGGSNGSGRTDAGPDGGRDGGGTVGDASSGSNGDATPGCKTTCEPDECGAVSDGCGGVVQCLDKDSCPAGQQCGVLRPNRCDTPAPVECTPKTAAEVCAGKCGAVSDGCSSVVTCDGTNGGKACTEEGQVCGGDEPNVCKDSPQCEPANCASRGMECGLAGDTCGGILDCGLETGGCEGDDVCGSRANSNKCVPSNACVPKTAAVACATTCGRTGDGCGGLIDCEADAATSCGVGTTCGGGGVAGVCGNAVGLDGGSGTCMPVDAVAACAGKCGLVSDGCGAAYTCADHGGETCDANDGFSCGGGGQANQCGKPECTPLGESQACPGAGDFKSCGRVADGCGRLINCGDCLDGQTCGLDAANVCAEIPSCEPAAVETACMGKCGVVPDGCGDSYTCSAANGGVSCTGDEFCGALSPNECDPPEQTCTPKTCAELGHSCGLASDGCGDAINCWPGCSEDDVSCEDSCGDSAQACVSDDTTGAQTCVMGSGSCTGSLCDDVPTCAPSSLTRLTGTVRTPGIRAQDGSIINQIAVPNVVVYIPANPGVALPAIFEGVDAANAASCGRCEDEALVADGETVLAAAVTDYKGEFSLEGRIPVGTAFNLVVKAGKWRRVVQVPADVAGECEATQLDVAYTRLSRNSTDGRAGTQLPKIAISTGRVDEMECVFRNMGIDAAEFTSPSSNGRIHMYRSNGARIGTLTSCSGEYDSGSSTEGSCQGWGCSGSTEATCSGGFWGCTWEPDDISCEDNDNEGCRNNYAGCRIGVSEQTVRDELLYSDQSALNSYDLVVWDCEGEEEQHNEHDAKVEAYVNAGGRMFASHFSYAWIEGNGSLADSAAWGVDTADEVDMALVSMPSGPTSRTGANPTKSLLFRDWLDHQGALEDSTPNTLNNPTPPRFLVVEPRDRAGATVGDSTDEWVYRVSEGAKVQQLSFNTPYGASAENICGRVAYSGFHVAAETGNSADDAFFPWVCSNEELSAQEKVLVFMLFDLAACVSEGEPPQPPECTPKTGADLCPEENDACGLLSDGCGNLVDCGGCSAGFYCDGSSCRPQQCTPSTCSSLGFNCGLHADGCGGLARDPQGNEGCGDCTDNQVCGLGGPGLCGSANCDPIDLEDACPPGSCGQVSDGCGGTVNCGDCPDGQVCGGGGPNTCGEGSCTPIPIETACKDLNCGLVSDGCGGTHKCGDCLAPESCGGGGTPNVCGKPDCEPYTKAEACNELECGWVSDGCGGAIYCGDCEDGAICGGAGPNLCGAVCAPTSCEAKMAECGKIGDDCGEILDCGPCPPGETCGAGGPNKCAGGTCEPTSCEAQSAECGLIGDGCGAVVDCGPCTEAGETCGGAGTPNECGMGEGGCNELTCEVQEVECGAAGDGCGGLLDCGACPPGFDCERGKCEPLPQ